MTTKRKIDDYYVAKKTKHECNKNKKKQKKNKLKQKINLKFLTKKLKRAKTMANL